MPEAVGIGAWVVACAIGVVLAWQHAMRTGDGVLAVIESGPLLVECALIGFGIYLGARGWPRRVGSGMHCARCAHPYSQADDQLLNQCQECGANWRWFGGLTHGRIEKNAALVAIGLVVVGLTAQVSVLSAGAPGLFMRALPSHLLFLKIAASDHRQADAAWTEIKRRMLSDHEQVQLAGSITDRRLRQGTVEAELANRMAALIQADALPAPLRERWFNEMFFLMADVPQVVNADERIVLRVNGVYRGGWLGVADAAQVISAGAEVLPRKQDDQVRVLGRQAAARPAEVFRVGAPVLVESFLPDGPGEVTVRLSFWFVIGPPIRTVVYDDRGQPILGDKNFAKRFEIVRTIAVRPAETPGN